MARAASSDLPVLGEVAGDVLSIQDERRLGREFMRELRRTMQFVDDDLVADYVNRLGGRLASALPDKSRRFDFFVVDDRSINAFAGPGGHIGVNSGLILMAENESELASVLAHEIAHVTQRHLARTFEKAATLSLPMAAAVISSIILGSQDGQAGAAALAATAAGSVQTQINFTRANEQEADRVGLEILAAAGYDPRNMPSFFQRLRQATRLSDNEDYEFLRTHPVTSSRIADTMGRADQYPHFAERGNLFPWIQSRLRVTASHDPTGHLEFFHAQMQADDPDLLDAARYGLILSLIEARRMNEARNEFGILAKELKDVQDDRRLYLLLLEATLEMESGEPEQALSVLAPEAGALLERTPFYMLYSEALFRQGKYRLVRENNLRRIARVGEDEPSIYRLQARVETKLGFAVQAHYSLGEFYYLNGDLSAAIRQLEIARSGLVDKKGNLAQRIEARLTEFHAQETQR